MILVAKQKNMHHSKRTTQCTQYSYFKKKTKSINEYKEKN